MQAGRGAWGRKRRDQVDRNLSSLLRRGEKSFRAVVHAPTLIPARPQRTAAPLLVSGTRCRHPVRSRRAQLPQPGAPLDPERARRHRRRLLVPAGLPLHDRDRQAPAGGSADPILMDPAPTRRTSGTTRCSPASLRRASRCANASPAAGGQCLDPDGSDVQIGRAVTSYDNTRVATATFDQISR